MTTESIGPFQITGTLGEGGMGKVYRALQPSVNREVALKVLSSMFERDPDAVARFRREAETAGNLRHPNIVQVWDASLSNPPYYIAMEYLGGGTLEQILARGPMPLGQAAATVFPLCAALDYAHGRGIIHRDMKPANIMFDASGQPVLTDFGIVRVADQTNLTVDGSRFGTPDYMSPEQAKGLALDSRSDLYSLGVVFYQMITGRVPFTGEPLGVMYKHVNEPVPGPCQAGLDLPLWLDAFIGRALAKRPEDRFQTGAEFAAELQEGLRGAGVSPVRASPRRKAAPLPNPVGGTATPPTGITTRAKRVVLAAALTLVLGLIGALALWVLHPAGDPPPPPRGVVPDVCGLTITDASSALVRAGFTPVAADRRSDPRPRDTVCSQEPPAGTSAQRSSAVALAISDGQNAPESIAVPDVCGFTIEKARDTLASAGFTSLSDERRADPRPKDTVCKQDPPPGAMKPKTCDVHLVISDAEATPTATAGGTEDTYEDAADHYTVRCPGGWRTRKSVEDEGIRRTKFTSSDGHAIILVDCGAPGSNPHSTAEDMDTRYAKAYGSRYQRVSITDSTVAGYAATRWEFIIQKQSDGERWHKVDTFIHARGVGYAVLCQAKSDEFDSYRGLFARVQDEFTIR